MNYDTKGELIDGDIYRVDTTPKYPLGKTVLTSNGRVARYVKATAALSAGTSYAVAGTTALTSPTAINGGLTITAATPSTTNYNDLVGGFIKVTRSAAVVGVYPIRAAVATDSGATLTVPEVKSGDTVALVAYGRTHAGGTANKAGAEQATPVANIASGSYGWVVEVPAVVAS